MPRSVDGLLLDPDHKCAESKQKVWLQNMHAECLAQLAVHDQGLEALLADPSVVPALQEVADKGLSEQSREYATQALMAMSDKAIKSFSRWLTVSRSTSCYRISGIASQLCSGSTGRFSAAVTL